MSNLQEPARQTAVIDSYDVIVCGGGPAGVAAALAAAEDGARTLLLEAEGCLGGVWTAGCLAWILDHENKQGLMQAIFQRLEHYQARTYDADGSPTNAYDVERMKLVLDELCLEAGVTVRLHSRVAAALRNDANALSHVVTESIGGREAFAGSVFIDCTGNGVLGALAGCAFDFGHPETGATQPFSMLCLLTGVDAEAMHPYMRNPVDTWAAPKQRLREQMERGGNSPSYNMPSLFRIRDDLYLLMANHEYGYSGIDTGDVTAATLSGRAEVHRLIDGLRQLGDPWSNLQIVATSAQIGIREGRRVHGLYTVTEDDLRHGARHDDAVCRVTFPIDVHSTDKGKNKGIEQAPFRSQPYDIPLRALVARDVDGLMMAGRCISGDFLAHSSYRVTGNSVALGEAAGRTAARAAAAGVTPRELCQES